MSGQNTAPLTVAQKHEMLLAFNAQREQAYDDYITSKNERKAEEEKAGTRKEPLEYGKLYKHFGADNKNKDMRMQLHEEVNMYTDN